MITTHSRNTHSVSVFYDDLYLFSLIILWSLELDLKGTENFETLSSPVHRRFFTVTSGGYKTDYNFNNFIATLSFHFFGKKKLPANVMKVWAAILNLVQSMPQ